MVPWWKRLILSAISWLTAGIAIVVILALQNIATNPNAHFETAEFLGGIWVVVCCSVPGLLLAIPIILTLTNIRGWRFWIYLAIGSSIGPLLILGFGLYIFLAEPNVGGLMAHGAPVIGLATAVSCLTSLFFLLLLRRVQAAMVDKGMGRISA